MCLKIDKISSIILAVILSFAVLFYSIRCEDKTLLVVAAIVTWVFIFYYCIESNINASYKGVILMASSVLLMGLDHFLEIKQMPEPLYFIYETLAKFIIAFSGALGGVLVAKRFSAKDEDKNT
jgi:uncharacterized membrane protein YccC